MAIGGPQVMTGHLGQLVESTARRRYGQRLAVVAILLGTALFLLWWIDPGQLDVPLCAFRAATGLHCPGCGATRATHELLHGRLLLALQDNALWVLALPLALYAAVSETRYLGWGRPLPGNLARRPWFFIVIGVVALVFGVLRNVPSYPFNLLIPLG